MSADGSHPVPPTARPRWRALRCAAAALGAAAAALASAAPAGPSPVALLSRVPPPPTSVVEAKARCEQLLGLGYTSATGWGDRKLAEVSRELASTQASLTTRQGRLATAMPTGAGAETEAIATLLEGSIRLDERTQALAERIREYQRSGEGKTFSDRRTAALAACERKLQSCRRDCLGPTRACVKTVYAVDDAALGAFARHYASLKSEIRQMLDEAAGSIERALAQGPATPAVEARVVELQLRMISAVAALVHEVHVTTADIGTSRYLGVEHP